VEKKERKNMPTPYDVPASILIKRLCQYFKNNLESIKPPEWAPYVKTGTFNQRTPDNNDWWFIRCASILRKIYLKGPIGIEKLRSEFGGKKDQGMKPEHSKKGSGAIIRNALKQLEESGLIQISKKQGRIVTSQGRKILDLLSTEMKKELEKKIPELKKY
jgi:small subunit ribosomal protein S19e